MPRSRAAAWPWRVAWRTSPARPFEVSSAASALRRRPSPVPLRGRDARESHRALPTLQQGASGADGQARNGSPPRLAATSGVVPLPGTAFQISTVMLDRVKRDPEVKHRFRGE